MRPDAHGTIRAEVPARLLERKRKRLEQADRAGEEQQSLVVRDEPHRAPDPRGRAPRAGAPNHARRAYRPLAGRAVTLRRWGSRACG